MKIHWTIALARVSEYTTIGFIETHYIDNRAIQGIALWSVTVIGAQEKASDIETLHEHARDDGGLIHWRIRIAGSAVLLEKETATGYQRKNV